MARLPRIYPSATPKHIIQRHDNREVCFSQEQHKLSLAQFSTCPIESDKTSRHRNLHYTRFTQYAIRNTQYEMQKECPHENTACTDIP